MSFWRKSSKRASPRDWSKESRQTRELLLSLILIVALVSMGVAGEAVIVSTPTGGGYGKA